MLASIHALATVRLAEVRSYHAMIVAMENDVRKEPLDPWPDEILIMRGLYYVYLYGAFEFSILRAVQFSLQIIASMNPQYKHFEPMFFSVALDSKFRSLKDSGRDKKWSVRHNMITQQFSDHQCRIDDSIFDDDLQNIHPHTIKNIFDCFNIRKSPTPSARISGYVEEVKNKRNAVAHGRESPKSDSGSSDEDYRSRRYSAVSDTIEYVLDCFTIYLERKEFLSEPFRSQYSYA